MSELQTAHTADLDTEVLRAAQQLLEDVFGDEWEDDDWEHSLGGVHADLGGRRADPARVNGHAAAGHDGCALRCGYVEGVAVRADHQRRGHGATLMEAVERVIRSAYDLGALGGTDEGAPLLPAARLEDLGEVRSTHSPPTVSCAPTTSTARSTCSASARSTWRAS